MTRVMVIPVFIPHRGCPHRCIFCNQNLITAGAQKLIGSADTLDIDCIISEYLAYRGSRERVELAFFGGNFLGLPEGEILSFLNAAAPWLEKGLIHGVRCSTRPDTVTPNILKKVKPLGLDLVELGVQSLDDRVLKLSRRGHTREDTLRAAACLKEAGMGLGVQLMTGLPGDTGEICENTAREAAGLDPDLARIYPALVLAGSPLARLYHEGGYSPQELDEAVARVSAMVRILEGSGVPVVRMGLQAGDGLEDDGGVLAGPWHPAFGHLVRSALVLDAVRERVGQLLETRPVDRTSHRVALSIHPQWESRLRGDKNHSLKALGQEFPGLDFQVSVNSALASGQIEVTWLP